MEWISYLIDLVIHLDQPLAQLVSDFGPTTYIILFIVIFCETGLVVTPFLPGDSLLFAAGALSAHGALNVHLLAALLFVAAVIGDAVNYFIGFRIVLVTNENSRKLDGV